VSPRCATTRVAAALLVALAGGSAHGETTEIPVPSAAPARPTDGAHGSTTRPDYDCTKGGFCGSDGWAYGSYASDTKESTGCEPRPDGTDDWDRFAAQTPVLPEFARSRCAFFYGFGNCWVPRVVCEN
jgi:hypothetical protein